MLKAQWPRQLLSSMLCVLAFVIPFPFIFGAVSVIAVAIIWLLQCDLKNTWHNLKTRKVTWLWFAYFLLTAAGYFYSNNKGQSLFDIQQKVSFVVLPVIIGAGIDADKNLVEKVLRFFIYGVAAIALFCIARAGIKWHETGDTKYFFYHDLTDGLDASAVYQAWYAFIGIAAMLLFPWQTPGTRRLNAWKVFLTLLMLVFFVLLSSRTLLAVFIVVVVPVYLYSIAHAHRIKRVYIGSAIAMAVVIIGLFVGTSNPVRQRYLDVTHNHADSVLTKTNLKDFKFTNLTTRLFFWRVALQNVREHHLWLTGIGNGDMQDLQNKTMDTYGLDIFNRNIISPYHNANVHNMYLQSLLMSGIIGILLFTLIVITPFWRLAPQDMRRFLFVFYISGCIFMFQESSLQTQAGIIFYTFFYQLFLSLYFKSKYITSKSLISY